MKKQGGYQAFPSRGLALMRIALTAVAFLVTLSGPAFSAGGSAADIDIADVPMDTRFQPAPANIMFVLDDSGSMSFSVLVRGIYDGQYPNPAQAKPEENGYSYVFDNLGDSVYTDSRRYFGPEGRRYWQSQWSQVNVMYYNPAVTYKPWPGYGSINFADADAEFPRPHPVIDTGRKLDLDGISFTVGGVDVKNAHYFTWSTVEAKPYLVVIDGDLKAIQYYAVTPDGGTGMGQKVQALTPDGSPPADVVSGRSYDRERQNFANWYTYHRRREYAAKAALGKVIQAVAGVRVGIFGINNKIIEPLVPVKVRNGGVFQDNTEYLLDKLYGYQSKGGTPLRKGLETVGAYFKKNDGKLAGVKGEAPYAVEAEGGACQQSFAIIMTDGYYSGSDPNVGNADQNHGFPYEDHFKNTLADVAMHYYDTDLAPGLPDEVPANDYDHAIYQHLVSYGVAFGVSGTLEPADFGLDPLDPDNYLKNRSSGKKLTWPKVNGVRQPESIDDLWHATVNGRGQFLNAGNPEELVRSLTELIENISQRLGSSSSVSVNGDRLFAAVSGDTLLFQASYNTKDWSGDVKAFEVDPATGEVIANSPKGWSASEKLDSATDPALRNILTYNGTDSGKSFVASQLTADQKALLGADVPGLVSYLRGSDIAGYRIRSHRLGDIVHSSPVFEHNVVYVGANDGMLHAFDAISGSELFAYVPNLVFAHLKELADPGYLHHYFVDLTPTVQRGVGLLGGNDPAAILVGGLGKGGPGYFALDVTDATAMDASRVLWEFSSETEDADMGYSFSRPVVVPSNDASRPWIVICGNGYNSADGKAVLYALAPQTGEIIKKFEAEGGPANGLSSPLAVDVNDDGRVDFVYAGDLKGNLWKFDLTGSIADWDVAYKNGASPAPLFQAQGPGGKPQPITTKPDAMFHCQKPGILVVFGTGKYLGDSDALDHSQQTIYGIWDYGDRAYYAGTAADFSVDDDSEYLGSFERGAAAELSNQPENVTLLRQDQIALLENTDVDGNLWNLRFLSDHQPSWGTTPDLNSPTPQPGERPALPDPVGGTSEDPNHAGWYFDLPLDGERIVSDVLIRDGVLLAITFTPDDDRCSPGGSSIVMAVNACSGGRLPGAQFDLDNNSAIQDPGDYISVEINGEIVKLPPSGIQRAGIGNGNLQPPAILKLNRNVEVLYLSSSTGGIETLHQKPARLGVSYWMEMQE